MNAQTPNEQIKFIHDVIKDRKDKNQATFFSVKLNTNGRHTPLVDKETGDTFYETMIQYLTRYDVTGLIIELYHGKSNNIKEPFQSFLIPIKRTMEMNIGYSGTDKKDELPVTPAESVITVEKHYTTVMDRERQLMAQDYEIKHLRYENEEIRRKNRKRKEYIEELEDRLEKAEQKQKNGLGNVVIGQVAGNAFETFVKSNTGITLLRYFGMGEEAINGLLGINPATPQAPETKSTASIIPNTASPSASETAPLSENDKIKHALLKELGVFFQSLDDGNLRLYFELIKLTGKNTERLKQLYLTLQYHIQKEKAESEKTGANQQTKASTSQTVWTEANKDQGKTNTPDPEKEQSDEQDTDPDDPDENDSS